MSDPETYSYGTELLNMLLTLGFVIGLAFVSILFLRKIMRSKMRQLNKSTGIKILERRALNQKSSLYLVDILGKGVVIAESQAGGVQLITEFPPGTDLELLLAEEESLAVTTKSSSLTQSLQKFFKRDKVKQ